MGETGEKGFSITELLVVVAIIILMTGLILPNWRSGERSLALERSASKLGQDVRRAQELAMRAQAFICSTGSISGYGIFFDENDPDSYILFAECNGTNVYNSGVDGIVEEMSFESGVEIASASPSSSVSIVFIPPTPKIFINGEEGGLNAQVILQRSDSASATRTITVTSKGIIDVD